MAEKSYPATKLTCDACGQTIIEPEDGWVEWKQDAPGEAEYDFRVVHHSLASPRQPDGSCYYPRSTAIKDNHLRYYLGQEGLLRLLVLVRQNANYPASVQEIVELIYRLHIPDDVAREVYSTQIST